MRITQLMNSQMVLSNLEQSYSRMSATAQELSSGKRISQPSDDPYGTSRAMQLTGQLADLTGYQNSVDDGTAWTQTADSTLSAMNNAVQRVRELVVQAGTGTNSPSAQAAAAAEVDQLTQSVKQLANTTYAGQYIFSGTATATPPYQQGAVDTYAGNSGVLARAVSPGTTIAVNSDVSQVLGQGGGDGKLLDVLRNISADMRGGTAANGNALRTTDLASLDTNMSAVSTLQATVGATENRLSLASSQIQDLTLSQTKMLASTENIDFAAVATDYANQQATYTAALHVSATIVQQSLLNFLTA